MLSEANICVIFVPGGCTGELQPLDVAVNGEFKTSMKTRFSEWYSAQVASQLSDGKEFAEIDVQLSTALIKPNFSPQNAKLNLHRHFLVYSKYSAQTRFTPPTGKNRQHRTIMSPKYGSGGGWGTGIHKLKLI